VPRIVTEQSPSAKPVPVSAKVTDQWVTIIDVPDYDVPVVGFGTTRRIAPGVGEISSPLLVANISNASQNISVRIIRSERYLTASQDETSFDNLSANGTFIGGSGYETGDTITLDNGATILVDAQSSGTITEFSITSVGNRVNRSGAANTVLTQLTATSAVAPSGFGFVLTAKENNYDPNDGIYVLANDYPVEIRDTMIIPLNGQFLVTGDRLQIKGSTNDSLIATISYTEGQSEEDDVFTGL